MADVFINWGDSSGQTITLTGSSVNINHTYVDNSGYTITLSGRTSQISGMTLSGSNITELSGFSDSRITITSLNLNNNKLIKFPAINNNLKELQLNHNTFYSGSTTGTTTDYDNNTYHTVVIGSQEWMVENLKTTHYADGTPIPLVTGSTSEDIKGVDEWINSDSPDNWDTFDSNSQAVWNLASNGSHVSSCYRSTSTPSPQTTKLYIAFYFSNPYGDANYSPRMFVYDENNTEYLNIRVPGPTNYYTYVIDVSGSTGKFTMWLYNTDENKENPRYIPNFSLYNLVMQSYAGWYGLSIGAYCWYNNNESYKNPYGALYNAHVVSNIHGLAPNGWRIANSRDWLTLISYIGGEYVAGGLLKETGTTHWSSPNVAATNSYGFTAVGNGFRYEGGSFSSLGSYSYIWTSSKSDNTQYVNRIITYNSSGTSYSSLNNEYGLAIRCVRDIPTFVTNEYSGTTLETISMDNCSTSTYNSGSFPNTLNNFSANDSLLDSNSVSNIINDMYNNSTDKSTMVISLINTIGALTGTTEKYELIDNSGSTIKTVGRFEILVDRRTSTNVIPPQSKTFYINFEKPVTSKDINVYINWGDNTEESTTFYASSTYLNKNHTYYTATTFTVQVDTHWDEISYIYTMGGYYNYCPLNLKEFVGLKTLNIPSTQTRDVNNGFNGNDYSGVLDFSRNKLLENIDISYNSFSSMIYPDDVSKFVNITTNGCTGMVAPPTDMMPNLEYLSMQNCNMTGTLVDILSDKLTRYNIGGNYSLNPGPIPDMTNCTGLTDLYLDGCNLTSNGTTDFTTLTSLEHLSITSNYSLTGSVPKLDNLNNLQTMSINNTGYQWIGDTNWDTLSGLTSIYMGYNYYMSGLTPTLSSSTSLTFFNIPYNQFYGNLPDFTLFTGLTNISTYYNRVNYVDEKGISGPLPDLTNNPLLNYLDLSDCYLSRHKQLDAAVENIIIDSSGKVYAGGQFTQYSGVTQRGVARFNSNGSRDSAFNTGGGCGPYYNGFVYGIATDSSDKIYAGGYFTIFSGLTQNKLVKINTNGTKDETFDIGPDGFNSEVYCVATGLTNKVYVGGAFTQFSGLTQQYIIRLDSGGTKDTSFVIETEFNSIVRCITVDSNDKIYVGGNFNYFDSSPQYHLIRLNSGGTKDESFNIGTGFDETVHSVVLESSGKIYVGGQFSYYNGLSQNHLIRLNSGGTKDTSFDIGNGFDSIVYCIDVDSNGKVYVGGRFISFSGSTQNRLIRLNTNGTKDETFNIGGGFNGDVKSIKVDSSGKVYVGGEFTEFNNLPQMHMVRLNTNGTKDTSFTCFEPTTLMDLSNNTNLYGLTLRSCNIDYYDDSLFGLSTLSSMDLNNNKLKTFPDTSMMTNLSSLSLGGNLINQTIPDTFSGNTSLNTLTFENNSVYGNFPDWFTGLTSLQTIDVSYNDMSGRFPEFFTGMTNISYLRLNSNNFTSGFTALSGMTTNLRQLRINNNNFSGETMFDLTPFIYLNDVDASYCNLSGNLIMSDSLQIPYMFNFSYNNLSGDIPSFPPGYSYYNATLNCSYNQFTGYTSMAGSSHYFAQIDFSYNYLPTVEVNKVISDAVKSVHNNGTLYLSGDYMGLPNGQGLTDIDILTDRYWKVTVNLIKVGGGGFNSTVHDIDINSSGQVYVGGRFNKFSGTTEIKIVGLESTGTKISTFNPSLNYDGNPAYTISFDSSGHTYVGGYLFYGTGNDYLVRLDSGGTIDSSFDTGIGFNGVVNDAFVDSDDKVYLGGSFSSYKGVIGPKRIIRLNTDGTVDTNFVYGTGFDGPVYDMSVDSNNKVYIGGGFTNYNSTYSQYFVKLNADGTKDSTFVNRVFNNVVYCSLSDTANDKLYLGGAFSVYNSLPENYLIRLNSDGTKDEAFNIGDGFNSNVMGLTQYSDKIYAYGYFTEFSGSTQNRLIRLNSNGTKDETFEIGDGFDSNIYFVITGTSGTVYVGGSFTQFSGLTQNYLIRLDSGGTKDETFDIGNGFGSNVTVAVKDSNGKLYVGGNFTSFSGVTQNYLIRLNTDGTKDETFDIGSGFDQPITAMLLHNDKLYITGYFTTYSGITISPKYVIVLNTDGSVDNTFDIGTGFDNIVSSLGVSTNNELYFGGYYQGFNTLRDDNGIIKLNPDGSKDDTFNTGNGFNSAVYGIVTGTTDKIYVYGAFTSYNGQSCGYIIRLDSGGTKDDTFNIGSGFNSPVYDVVFDSTGNLYVGGAFQSFNGFSQNYMIKLDSGGTRDTSFDIGPDGFNSYVTTLAIDDSDRIYAGGYFTSFSGVTGTTSTNEHFIRLNSDGTKDETFDIGVGVDGMVNKIKIDSNGKILVGGDFGTFNKTTQNRIVRLNVDGTIDNSFYTDTNVPIMDESNGLMFQFVAGYYQSGTVIISGSSFIVYANGSGFIWDYKGSGEYQFNRYSYQTITRDINGTNFNIRYVSGGSEAYIIKISLSV